MRATSMSKSRKPIFKRAATAYLALLGLPGVILVFSLAQGAGWKPILAGMPVILTIFASITYQFVKELRAVSRDGVRPCFVRSLPLRPIGNGVAYSIHVGITQKIHCSNSWFRVPYGHVDLQSGLLRIKKAALLGCGLGFLYGGWELLKVRRTRR